ncbi:DUF4192 domain-containing protein [Streptomyces sp. NPDC047028]|uniref:DUF4192 domain-containing protein n=1 Tax=Streptomyces sp. NPDC047028 TaxID=3155793 RepID=UPI0033E00855
MTNHSETTGPFEDDDLPGSGTEHDAGEGSAGGGTAPRTTGGDPPGIVRREPLDLPSAHDTQVILRTPAELADALPYLLGYRPEDSIVLVALHDRDRKGRFGGRARLGIPASLDDWEAAARQLARGLVTGAERRGPRPEQMVAYVCQEPGPGETGRDVMRRLRPLAQLLRTECGDLDVPVIEALCLSDGRFWSYCCAVEGCCPGEGSPMGLPGTSVLAAAATYAGIQVRGTLRELRDRLSPWETAAAVGRQEIALDTAGTGIVPRIVDDTSRAAVADETLDLAERVIRRFAEAPPVSGTHPADLRDDELLTHEEAAVLILGLQDRTTRDQAAAWMEGEEAGPALRLWRALARRCVGPYGEHAAAPLTLAGWVAWSTGDELEAREALAMALGADPDYLFARLLHQACNEGLDPESIRRCLRTQRAAAAAPVVQDQRSEEAGSRGVEVPADTTDAADRGLAVSSLNSPGAPRNGTSADGAAGPGRPWGPAVVAPGDEPHDEPGPVPGPRRRRRGPSSHHTDSGPRPARAGAGRRRQPIGTRPRPSVAGRSGAGTGPDGTRTRAADRRTSAAPRSTAAENVPCADARPDREGDE